VTVFSDDDLLPLSALQHLVFCERQCALIHVEGQWQENPLTFEGRQMHERVDRDAGESRRDVRILRGLTLVHRGLGLAGRADVVELHRDAAGVPVPGVPGRWRPFPVEYKRGRPKAHDADRVQLCAQALCLEEMWSADVPAGALFYGQTRRRDDVAFDAVLRAATVEAARRVREILESGETPSARKEKKCARCSLLDRCRPDAIGRSASRYLDAIWAGDEA
jgi:CRISPR-associated exonuclease Cas4